MNLMLKLYSCNNSVSGARLFYIYIKAPAIVSTASVEANDLSAVELPLHALLF